MPAKKPTALKELEGTARADRTNPLEPRPDLALPDRPEWADDDPRTAQLFDQIVEYLSEMKIATRMDGIAVSLLADQLDLYLTLRQEVRTNGETVHVTGRDGVQTVKPNPALVALNNAFNNIMKLLTEYGLTAVSRSRVSIIKEERDDFASFLSGGD